MNSGDTELIKLLTQMGSLSGALIWVATPLQTSAENSNWATHVHKSCVCFYNYQVLYILQVLHRLQTKNLQFLL